MLLITASRWGNNVYWTTESFKLFRYYGDYYCTTVLEIMSSRPFSCDILTLCLYKIVFDWTNCLIDNKYNNLTMRLIISQEQSWPSGLSLYLISHKWVQCWFSGQNSWLAVQIFFCPDFSPEHFKNYFQKSFWAPALDYCLCHISASILILSSNNYYQLFSLNYEFLILTFI